MAEKNEVPPVNGQTVQPGAVISPDGGGQTAPEPPPAQSPAPAPEPEASPQALAPEPPQPPAAQQPAFNDDQAAAPQESDPDEITWTASEFVAHDKSASWYFMLAIAAVLIAAGAYLITRDYVSVGVVLAAALLLGYFASHKPRQLEYRMNANGIEIDKKAYYFNEFRTFSVIPEGAFSSIVLMPLKRFAPALSIYFAPEDEDKIINLLSSILPFEERRRDAVDSLMHRIRF